MLPEDEASSGRRRDGWSRPRAPPPSRPRPPAPPGPGGRGRAPGGPLRGGRDRAVTQLRPEAHLDGLLGDLQGRACAPTRGRGGTVTLEVPRRRSRPPRAGPDDRHRGRLRGRRPADRGQAVGPRRPPGARALARHAGQRAAGPRRPVRRDRRRRPAGDRPPARPRHDRPADRRPHDAAQASVMAQLKARRVRKTYLALVQGRSRPPWAGSRRRSGATPRTANGWPSCRTAGRPRPDTASASGSRAGRCSSSISSPVARTRSGSTSRPSATPSRATRCTGPGRRARGRTGWSACSSTPGGWSSCRPRRRSWSGWRRRSRMPRIGAGEPSGGRIDGRAAADGRQRMTGPEALLGAPGALLVIITGPSGVGKDTIIDALRERPARARLPLRRDLHHARPATRRGRRRLLPVPQTHAVPRPARRRRAARGERGPRQLVRDAPPRGGGGARQGR